MGSTLFFAFFSWEGMFVYPTASSWLGARYLRGNEAKSCRRRPLWATMKMGSFCRQGTVSSLTSLCTTAVAAVWFIRQFVRHLLERVDMFFRRIPCGAAVGHIYFGIWWKTSSDQPGSLNLLIGAEEQKISALFIQRNTAGGGGPYTFFCANHRPAGVSLVHRE